MPVPSTADQFIELTVKSGLLDATSLDAYRKSRRSNGEPVKDPGKLASLLVQDGLLTRYQVGQLLRGKWRNFVLSGKYKILGPLGSGGMGHVFLCEHQVMRRYVAIKVLPPRSSNPAALERFRREARAVAQLHHHNIVGGHDIDQSDKLHFLVMEYIDGNTLHHIVKKHGPMDAVRAAHYVRQAALGLQHAHEAGLVHRDIKPSNLLLDRTGTVKVLDLGLARFFHDESDDLSKQEAHGPVGTSDYMAPEQALNSHEADIRADIYSLGATFYFLLAGHSPFREGTALQKLICHQFDRPRPIRDIRPEVPEGLAFVLDRMMAKDLANRYQSPAEVEEALVPWTKTRIPAPAAEEMPELVMRNRAKGRTKAAPDLPESLFEPGSTASASEKQPDNPTPSSGSRPPAGRMLADVNKHVIAPEEADSLLEAGPSPALPASAEAVKVPTTSSNLLIPSFPSSPGTEDLQEPPQGSEVARRRRAVLLAAVFMLLGTCAAAFAVYKIAEGRKAESTGEKTAGPPIAAGADPARLRLLAPAYFYPAGEGLMQWNRLLESPAAAMTVAIANPESGPGKIADANYTKLFARAREKGVFVIGYVSTNYGKRLLHEVKEEVDRWIDFYPNIQGIFFDEQTSVADQVPYYAALYDHVRKVRGLQLVITNPGTVCAETYVSRPASDVACVAEVVKDFGQYRRPGWTDRYPLDRFAALLCSTPSAEQMKKLLLAMPDNRIGYCYITDADEPNPWNRLPTYWEAEVEAIQEINRGP
ncbi:MAG: protein kinase domain-containing protein [Gemmataceae bacterium]